MSSVSTISNNTVTEAASTVATAMVPLSSRFGLKPDEIFVVIMSVLINVIVIVIFIVYLFYVSTQLHNNNNKQISALYGQLNGHIRSINAGDPNCKYKLRDYYIKSAYNCCSTGAYKNDYVDISVVKSLLKQGVRGLDCEVFNVNGEPVISTSLVDSNYVKETFNTVSFSDFITTVVNYGFSSGTAPNYQDPILLHLRIRTSNDAVLNKMAATLKQNQDHFLNDEYSFENYGRNLGDTPLLKLCNKVVLIVQKNADVMNNKNLMEFVNMTSGNVFMRGLTTNEIIQSTDFDELVNFNKRNMTISLAETGSASPTNASAFAIRKSGTQMIAMRFPSFDSNLMESNTFFDLNGYAFVLKPEELRYIPVTIPVPEPQNPDYSFGARNIKSKFYDYNI
jgi:hypothetical protein